MRRRRSSCRASFRCAAAFSTSSRRMRTTRCGSSCSATRSNRFAASTWPRSGAWKRSRRRRSRCSSRRRRTGHTSRRYLPPATWFLLIEPNELAEEGKFYLERLDRPQAFHSVRTTLEEIYKFPSVTAAGVPSGSMETTAHLEFESVERFSGDIAKVRDELDKVSRRRRRCSSSARRRPRSSGLARIVQASHGGLAAAENELHLIRSVGHLEAGLSPRAAAGRAGERGASCFSGTI